MKVEKVRSDDLREGCIREALVIIETSGIEALSLREVARRLGVSHQAPYKHFPSRDHVLAEIVARCFDSFALYLDQRRGTGSAQSQLSAMGEAYLAYAIEHPLQYRLMFSTPLPEPQQHPQMMRNAQHAFSLLRDCLAQIQQDAHHLSIHTELDAVFIWSSLHGLASLIQSQSFQTLEIMETAIEAHSRHLLMRLGLALELPESDQ